MKEENLIDKKIRSFPILIILLEELLIEELLVQTLNDRNLNLLSAFADCCLLCGFHAVKKFFGISDFRF